MTVAVMAVEMAEAAGATEPVAFRSSYVTITGRKHPDHQLVHGMEVKKERCFMVKTSIVEIAEVGSQESSF